MSDETIVNLPVKFRDNDIERVVTVVRAPYHACQHERFTVDDKLAQVVCRDCGVKLDPMQALVLIAHGETRYHELHARYQDEMKRLGERSKTKCQHCGKMTRVSQA